jgi:hypothetical protein
VKSGHANLDRLTFTQVYSGILDSQANEGN